VSSRPTASIGPPWASTSASIAVASAFRRTKPPGGRGTWRQIEAGQNDHPTDETLVRMARALLLDPAELMRQCQRRYVEAPSVRDLPPLGPPMALLEVLESDRRLDPRARRVLMELYDLLASR
jgi:hypothetical protein